VNAVFFDSEWTEVCCEDERHGANTRIHDVEEGAGPETTVGDVDEERREMMCLCVGVFRCVSMVLGALLRRTAPHSQLNESKSGFLDT
jgi:hypothetical protein